MGGGQATSSQRLRIVFRKGEEIKYISHLDLARAWERALRRASVGLAYSRGFNPRPRLVFASALPVGLTGRQEMMDVVLEQRLGLREFASRLRVQLPSGLTLVSVAEVASTLPALPNQVVAAEYRAVVESHEPEETVQLRLGQLMEAGSIIRRRGHADRERDYDLRPLIKDLWLAEYRAERCVIGMRLQATDRGTGRADEVMAALGMTDGVRSIERVHLVLAST